MKELVKGKKAVGRGSGNGETTLTNNWVTRNPKLCIAIVLVGGYLGYSVYKGSQNKLKAVNVVMEVNNNLRVPMEQITAPQVMGA